MKRLITALCLLAGLTVTLPAFAESTPATSEETGTTETVILTVDINKDSAEKISDLLNGVGPTKAQAIVEYREANGPFLSVDELANVPGIGPATVDKNRDAIVVSDS